MDWFHTDELVAKHAENPKVETDDIVAVDYVVKSRDFADQIDHEVDLVIANHVIEHVPDPIHWLSEASRCVHTNGRLFLAVPDRRYTFDYFRTESDAVEMVLAYEERRERATTGDIARHLYYFSDVTHTEIWETGAPVRFNPRMSFNAALTQAAALSEEYTDVHCWVFTTESFLRTFDALHSSGHVEWEIEAFEDVQPGQNEMRLLLRLP
jgi:SAM-dependent methyltransferase